MLTPLLGASDAAWTPALAREMTAVLLQHRCAPVIRGVGRLPRCRSLPLWRSDRVVVVEQPFPVELQSLGEGETVP